MKKLLIIVVLSIALLMGCLGQKGRQPVKQITAFLISVPCAAVGTSNECYEVVYMMMDSEEVSADDTRRKSGD